ncbi:MAG: hypothetical protein M1828_001155 [Chrysothrix sp. TS-e1954]|nr:MAG: hypothetical protein M1828_001155 [Chrysothrix sp. TS-e1954]
MAPHLQRPTDNPTQHQGHDDAGHPHPHQHNPHVRSTLQPRKSAPLYPAHTFSLSPTYHKWVKLTALDLHALVLHLPYTGQGIYHHLNHPIRFVYLCGIVTAIEFPHPRFVIFTLDDGSGRVVDVKVERFAPGEKEADKVAGSGTIVDGMKVGRECSEVGCGLEHLFLGGEVVRTGTVIKAKGVIETFRGMYQLLLKRASVVKSMAEEVEVWKSYADFVESTISKPWVLSEASIKKSKTESRERARNEERSRRERERRLKSRKTKRREWEMKMREWEERQEVKRLEEARVLDGNPLDRPGWQPLRPNDNDCERDSVQTIEDALPKQRRPESSGESKWFHSMGKKRRRSKDFDKGRRRKR